jgi:hypothetical protein
MELTKNGCSTTKRCGQFAYEVYFKPQNPIDAYRGKPAEQRVQWDYRDTKGKLFSGIAKRVEQARQVAANQSNETVDGIDPE